MNNIEKNSFSVLSSDNVHRLSGIVYVPKCEPKGFFHIVHGMTEHISRYDHIMTDLACEGYICFGYDHLGHGNTVNDSTELGFFASKNGWDLLLKDVRLFSDAVIKEYTSNKENKLPYFLMGHSMGSFIVRLAAEKYVSPDKLIVMGTSGPNPASHAGIMLADIIKLIRGPKHISRFIDKLAFGGYNTKFKKDPDANSKSWLTTDQSIREKYLGDKYCTFKFTVSAMGDLMRLLEKSNRPAWFKNISGEMPILMISGADDPVGNFGKGTDQVFTKLTKENKNVKYILYPKARHEILNDFTYDDVRRDLISFIK